MPMNCPSESPFWETRRTCTRNYSCTNQRSTQLHWRLRRPDHDGRRRRCPIPPLARETRGSRAGGPIGQPHRPARPVDRASQSALVRTQRRQARAAPGSFHTHKRLFVGFDFKRSPETHSGPSPVLVDKLHASSLQSQANLGSCLVATAQGAVLSLQPLYCRNRYVGRNRQSLLRPSQQCTRSLNLPY